MTHFVKTVYALWFRHVLVWRSMFWSSLSSNVFNPLLFLFSFGFGLGGVIESMEIGGQAIPYMAFIVPGMMAYGGMFSASFETSISAFARYYMQSYWDQVLSSPAQLQHLIWGEIIWATTKAMFAVACVFAVGFAFGGIGNGLTSLIALPFMVLGCLCFSACGMVATSFAKSFEMFSYYFTFWVTPMFIFSGVFFPIDRFPEFVQYFSFILPMTHLVDVIRAVCAGIELDLATYAYKLAYIVALTAAAYVLAYKNMKKRIFD